MGMDIHAVYGVRTENGEFVVDTETVPFLSDGWRNSEYFNEMHKWGGEDKLPDTVVGRKFLYDDTINMYLADFSYCDEMFGFKTISLSDIIGQLERYEDAVDEYIDSKMITTEQYDALVDAGVVFPEGFKLTETIDENFLGDLEMYRDITRDIALDLNTVAYRFGVKDEDVFLVFCFDW